MDETSKLCKATNLLVETESSFCFNDRTNKRIDLVVKIGNKDILIDAITIDANNSSNGFVKYSEDILSSYFPGAAAVIKARSKLCKFNAVIAASREFVPFVTETQGRWGFLAREIFKSPFLVSYYCLSGALRRNQDCCRIVSTGIAVFLSQTCEGIS